MGAFIHTLYQEQVSRQRPQRSRSVIGCRKERREPSTGIICTNTSAATEPGTAAPTGGALMGSEAPGLRTNATLGNIDGARLVVGRPRLPWRQRGC